MREQAQTEQVTATPIWVITGPGGTRTFPGNAAMSDFDEAIATAPRGRGDVTAALRRPDGRLRAAQPVARGARRRPAGGSLDEQVRRDPDPDERKR